jgi:hypothetical protein
MSSAENLRVHVAWFPNGGEEGKPALGTPATLPWPSRDIQAARCRLMSVERRAALLHQIGQDEAALRLAAVADGVRQVVPS